MSSPSFHAPHSLYELSTSSGSMTNLHTPLTSKGGRLRSKYRSKTPSSGAGDHGQSLPLEGRNEEINEVFAFLCPGFVAQFGPLTEFTPTAGKFSFGHGALASPILAANALSPGANGRLLRFDTTVRTKACIVQGPGGVGKSSFLKIFCEKVRNIHKSDPGINMVVFHSQTKGNNAQPFNVWKVVFRQLLMQFARLADPTGANKAELSLKATENGASQKDLANAAAKADLMRGLDYVFALLPEELQDLRPLLSGIHFVYGIKDNDTTSKLSGTRCYSNFT